MEHKLPQKVKHEPWCHRHKKAGWECNCGVHRVNAMHDQFTAYIKELHGRENLAEELRVMTTKRISGMWQELQNENIIPANSLTRCVKAVNEDINAICAKFTNRADERVALEFVRVCEVVSQIIPSYQTTIIEQISNRICSTFRAEGRLERLDEATQKKCLDYANDLSFIRGQVEVWNKENQSRAHYQQCLLGATSDLLKEIVQRFGVTKVLSDEQIDTAVFKVIMGNVKEYGDLPDYYVKEICRKAIRDLIRGEK